MRGLTILTRNEASALALRLRKATLLATDPSFLSSNPAAPLDSKLGSTDPDTLSDCSSPLSSVSTDGLRSS